MISLVPHDMLYGPQAALIAESFTGRLRYSGSSLGYQLASIIAGGPAPLIATWLFGTYHSSIRDRDLHRDLRGDYVGCDRIDDRLHRQGYFRRVRLGERSRGTGQQKAQRTTVELSRGRERRPRFCCTCDQT